MRVNFLQGKTIIKTLCLAFAAGFLAASAYAEADSRLRPTATGNSGNIVGELAQDLKATRMDGGAGVVVVPPAAQPSVKIFAENLIVSNGKGADVGRALRLEKLIEEGFSGALLGHSNTRKTFIKEFSKGNSRDNAFLRFDQLMNHRILAQLKAGITEISLCIGSDLDNLTVEQEIADVLKQLKVSLTDITQDQLREKTFNFAWEPAGNIGTGVAEGPEKIRIVHQAIYDFLVETYGQETITAVWGKSLRLLYGASVDGKNVDGIMAVKSVKPGMENVQLVHGVLFASSGKKVEGFLDVAYGVERAAARDNAQYVTFINLKEFLAKDKTPIAQYIGGIYEALMAGRVTAARNLLYIADQDIHLKTWQRAVKLAEGDYDGGAAAIPAINAFGPEELKGLKVLLRVDFNVSDEATGKIKSEKRIREAIPTIVHYIKSGATVVLSSHNGRPKGKVKPEASLGPVAERLDKILKEEGYDIKVVFHKDSVTSKGVKAGLRDEIVAGAVNVIENVRFAIGEEKNYESFYRDMAALADNEHFDFDAFGAGERTDAVGSAKYAQSVSQGFLMQKEDEYLGRALRVSYGLVVGGGPKLDEKLPIIKHVIANKKEKGGFTIWGTAPTTFFLDVLYGIKLGDSKYTDEKRVKSRQDNIGQVKEIMVIAEKAEMENVIGVDFIAVDRDLTGTAEGDKSWIDLKKIPDGAHLYQVTLEQLKAGKFFDEKTQKEVLVTDLFLYDIGDKSRELFKQKILSTPEGRSVFYNGTVGVFEMPLFASGGKAVDLALAELNRSGRISVIGGGDTAKEAEKNGVDKLVTHVSTGGGASAKRLQGKTLSAIKELNKINEQIYGNLEKMAISLKEFMQYLVANETVFQSQGAEVYNKFISGVKQSLGIKGGDLSKAQITTEAITDSRGRPTVRAKIAISGVEVVGEVPAGASTGEDEAVLVSVDQAIKNINEIIVPLLTKSGLDLSRHEDLLQAEKLIREKAGDNYKMIGANAVVPVSWALWRAAAKLHGMELWEYIRWNEPQLVGKNVVDFYSNVYNGGLHARKDGEALGKDRIDIQEVMAVIAGDRPASEKLAMDDKIDQELKKLLLAEAQNMGLSTQDLTRADEAGFSLKGLGSSEKAIELVAQAIKNAGYEPGKDVQLALDTAASTFVREVDGRYVYDFQGKEMTGRQMIDFYIDLAKKYPGFIRSIEDGLAENDWDNWVVLTAEMNKFNILTIGDDLFVTQMGRLKKGVEMKAASAILIKVNQNGSVSGTLEVIQYAREHGLEIVVSHRSGETLDPAIADLAYAVKAMGLKTGAPQPAVDFSDPGSLVRRAKYERLITIEKNPYLSGKAILVDEDAFKRGGFKNALSRLGELGDGVKVVAFGENAEKLKVLIGQGNVLTAKSMPEAVALLKNLGIAEKNIVLLSGAAGTKEASDAQQAGIRTIAPEGVGTLAVAQAVKEVINTNEVDSLFTDFNDNVQPLVTSKVSDEVRKSQDTVAEFMDKV